MREGGTGGEGEGEGGEEGKGEGGEGRNGRERERRRGREGEVKGRRKEEKKEGKIRGTVNFSEEYLMNHCTPSFMASFPGQGIQLGYETINLLF